MVVGGGCVPKELAWVIEFCFHLSYHSIIYCQMCAISCRLFTAGLLSSPPFRTNNMKVEASDSLADLLRTAYWARLGLH